MTQQHLPLFEERAPAETVELPRRPRTRGDCAKGVRPCPWVSCRYNLYLDVSRPTGNPSFGAQKQRVILNFGSLEPWEVPPESSCALDVADDGQHSCRELAPILGYGRTRIDAIAQRARHKLVERLAKDPKFSDLRDQFAEMGFVEERDEEESC